MELRGVSIRINEIVGKWLKKYPTRGKKITKHPISVSIFSGLVIVLAIALVVVTVLFSEFTSPDPLILGFFLALNFLIQFYYFGISIKDPGTFHEQPAMYFALVNIVLFNNVLILLLTPLVALLCSSFFGIRRLHAVLFNFSQQMIGLICAFWILQSPIVNLWENNFDLFLVSILCALTYMMINRLMVSFIISLSTKRKLSEILRKMPNFQHYLETLVLAVTCMMIVLIDRELFFLFFLLFFIVIRSNIKSIITFQKI
ncbi:MAG: hypothetical protein H7647_12090, partial [Candidatus Heimdallarchaeota archaeon]|nr:hypothetical protein [Candidatus Heimdallarchaeota archaeon]MCK4255166.1 hypothetical protein [Candidatus Heimdallarchaeota archaeon]